MSKIERLIDDSMRLEQMIADLRELHKKQQEEQNRLDVISWEMLCIENELKVLGGLVDG